MPVFDRDYARLFSLARKAARRGDGISADRWLRMAARHDRLVNPPGSDTRPRPWTSLDPSHESVAAQNEAIRQDLDDLIERMERDIAAADAADAAAASAAAEAHPPEPDAVSEIPEIPENTA